MTQNQEPKHAIYLDANNSYVYAMSKFFPAGRLKWTHLIVRKVYSRSRSWYPKELCQLHNDCTLAPDKVEIREKVLYKYKIMIVDLYNFLIGNVKNMVPNVFDKKYAS